MDNKDILGCIEVMKDICPLTKDYIDISNLNDNTNEELVLIYTDYIEIVYTKDLEDKRLQHLRLILLLIENFKKNEILELLPIPTLEERCNYSSISFYMLMDNIISIIINKYGLNTNKQEKLYGCFDDILNMELETGMEIMLFVQKPVIRFVAMLNNEEFSYEDINKIGNSLGIPNNSIDNKTCVIQ